MKGLTLPSDGKIIAASQTILGSVTLFLGKQPSQGGIFFAWIDSSLTSRFYSLTKTGQPSTLYAMDLECYSDCMAVFLNEDKLKIHVLTLSPATMQEKDSSAINLGTSVNYVRGVFENGETQESALLAYVQNSNVIVTRQFFQDRNNGYSEWIRELANIGNREKAMSI